MDTHTVVSPEAVVVLVVCLTAVIKGMECSEAVVDLGVVVLPKIH